MEKISTSIQYQLSNIKLVYDVFGNFKFFDQFLKEGPEAVKQYLYNQWYEIKEKVKDNDKLEIKDIDKEVTIDDFNITFSRTQKGTPVFYFTFPDYDFHDAASKYTALAITTPKLRYITYEYAENIITQEPEWMIGEFYVDNGNINHKTYGKGDDDRLSWFAGFVNGLLDYEDS